MSSSLEHGQTLVFSVHLTSHRMLTDSIVPSHLILYNFIFSMLECYSDLKLKDNIISTFH